MPARIFRKIGSLYHRFIRSPKDFNHDESDVSNAPSPLFTSPTTGRRSSLLWQPAFRSTNGSIVPAISSGPNPTSTCLYEILDPERLEIRLLDVEPGSGEDMLVCTMRHISLSDDPTPDYETISYCWGPPRETPIIKVNGHLVHVPWSSVAALKKMRLSDKRRTLWIDAICINQETTQEKNHQVALMSTIYRLGSQNLVYLGEDENLDAEEAVGVMNHVLRDMHDTTEGFTKMKEVMWDHNGRPLHSDDSLPPGVNFRSLQALFNRKWFTSVLTPNHKVLFTANFSHRRMWIVPEAALSRSNLCHWGEMRFDLLNVLKLANWLRYKHRSTPAFIRTCRGWQCARRMFTPMARENWNRLSILLMSFAMGQFATTEPRDMVYALLGLLSKEPRSNPLTANLLEVDYSKPLSAIMRDATRYALCEDLESNMTNSLWILGCIGHVEDMEQFPEFPSWTIKPDYALSDRKRVLPSFFNACRGLPAPARLRKVPFDPNLLMLEGFIVGQVDGVTDPCKDRNWHDHRGFHDWLHSILTLARDSDYFPNYDIHPSQRLSQIALTICAGRSKSGTKATSDDVSALERYFRELPGQCPRRNWTIEDEKHMKEMLAETSVSACENRRFFTTSTCTTGLGPASIRLGDFVVIVRGGQWPFILRQVAVRDYRLIGTAYVHGIMDGEAVRHYRKPQVIFEIR